MSVKVLVRLLSLDKINKMPVEIYLVKTFCC